MNRKDIRELAALFASVVNKDTARDEVRRDLAGMVGKFFADRHGNFDLDKFLIAAKVRT